MYKKKILGKKNGSASFYEVETGMQYVKHGGFAFQTDTSIAYHIIRRDFPNEIICDLSEVELYPSQYTTGIVQKRLPLKEILLYRYNNINFIVFGVQY